MYHAIIVGHRLVLWEMCIFEAIQCGKWKHHVNFKLIWLFGSTGQSHHPQHGLQRAWPHPWSTFTCKLRREKEISRCRKNRGWVLLVQMDSSSLSQSLMSLWEREVVRGEWRENGEDKAQHLYPCTPYAQPHTHRWAQRAFLGMLTDRPHWPLQICSFHHMANLIWSWYSRLPLVLWGCQTVQVLHLPTHIPVPRLCTRVADSPVEAIQSVTMPFKMWHLKDVHLEYL